MTHPLIDLVARHRAGAKTGITSVCSAHAVVIEAALCLARDTGRPALIEATCNQVNQDGGYTGMTPADFRHFVEEIAARVGLSTDQILLGGDHLGPNPWKHLPPADAMAKAAAMIAAFAAAGFTKLHLDCSMGCAGEPVALTDQLTADRAARLAAVAEAHAVGANKPVYIIGTEVPVPGGAVDGFDHLQITEPDAVRLTYAIHRDAFAAKGLEDAFSRVIGIVVQPGVEFGHDDIIHFAPEKAERLTATLPALPGVVFEAHSTDYQLETGLRQLVEGGFAILKVGPWLTFALREALYGLDAIADALDGHPPLNRLMAAMEAVMLAEPANWSKYYSADPVEGWIHRHFSYSDRIRYYWPNPAAVEAVARLKSRLAGRSIPGPLLTQFLPNLPASAARDFDSLLIAAVQAVLTQYDRAVTG